MYIPLLAVPSSVTERFTILQYKTLKYTVRKHRCSAKHIKDWMLFSSMEKDSVLSKGYLEQIVIQYFGDIGVCTQY